MANDDDTFPSNEAWETFNSQKELTNTLCMNLYLIVASDLDEESSRNRNGSEDDHSSKMVPLVHRLASLGNDINEYFQSLDYPWVSAIAPQFGVHKEDEEDVVLCLRGLYRYGSSVADEWRCVVALMDFTQQQHSSSNAEETINIVVECWDEDDGPILLIQASDHLPSVLSEGSHTGGRYRSWIKAGKVYFILGNCERELSLKDAFSLIQGQGLTVANPAVQKEIRSSSTGREGDSQQWQKTLLIVKDDDALLLANNPGLIHAAIEHEAAKRLAKSPIATTTTQPASSPGHRHVWLPARIGRTSYAMLRSMVPDDSSTFIYSEMGKIIECGVAAIQNRPNPKTVDRITAWRQHIFRGDIGEDLEEKVLLSCPVFVSEISSDRQSHFNGGNQAAAKEIPTFREFDGSCSIPEGLDIDSEAWMFLSEHDTDEAKTKGVNAVHKGINAFFTGDSSPDGVHGKPINYGKVMRILHTALQASSESEFQYKLNSEFDPFFTKDDYDLVSGNPTDQNSLESIMQSMDNELNRAGDESSAIGVMTNLLQSLESGGPGPARHLLNEMNQHVPNVTEEDFADE